MKSITILCMLLFITISAFAQDKIIKKTGESITCKVTELGASEVKYYYPENIKLIFGIDNALVDRVEFSTGEIVEIEDNTFNNPEYYAGQAKHALKVNFLSPLMGSTEFVFEKNIRPGRSWETALGIVGLGNDAQDLNPRGVYGKFAYKFMREPSFYLQKMHYSHLLKGAYIAPEIAVRYMSYDSYYWDYYYDSENNYHDRSGYTHEKKFTLAFLLKFGKQWVFDDSFIVDTYCGIGYGFGGDDYEALNYGFIVAPEEFPIAFTGGIRIGWAFGR